MGRTVGIGHQDFEVIRKEGYFYIDKTKFIREWWENGDSVTLLTRPRRFGKTLNISMLEKFFSVRYAERGDLFQGLQIWEEEKYRNLQGTYPVICLSFASVKEKSYEMTIRRICQILSNLYSLNDFLLDAGIVNEKEKHFFEAVTMDMDESIATMAVHQLSLYLSRYYGKKVIILLDEYDTPMQEAYIGGYWDELSAFTRSMFNAAFKTNPYLERAIMTGITRISRESIFSDLNNLKVITTTSDEYADCFGFTEEEVFAAMDEFNLSRQKPLVKRWYDGFTFGQRTDMYNPWSIINYLDTEKLEAYWANSSSNRLIGKLLQEGSGEIKQKFEELLSGQHLFVTIDEQIVYEQLNVNEEAIWSLLLDCGYLKVVSCEDDKQTPVQESLLEENSNTIKETENDDFSEPEYELALTNLEVKRMFRSIIHCWFQRDKANYNAFIKALLLNDVKAMNIYMNRVAMVTFSYFDTGKNPSGEEPERFYHGFVLGLMVELADRYVLTANRESGFGRYDVMLEPRRSGDDGIIIEFKVQDTEDEKDLSDTVSAALKQIYEKKYETLLVEKGVPKEKIRRYGFAFRGKTVLIGSAENH